MLPAWQTASLWFTQGCPWFWKNHRFTTQDVLTWLGVNILRFRTDPSWDKFAVDYSNWGLMNFRKRDSGEVRRRSSFSYSLLLCKIIHYLLWSGRRTQHTHYHPFTVKKQHSLWFPDIVYSIDLPGQYKFNIQTCKCSKAFYLGFFHPKGTTEKVLKRGLLRSIILKVVSDGNINYVILHEAEGTGVQRWWIQGFSYLQFSSF